MARPRDISKEEILNAARRLLQTRGCNGFSIRDVSEEVGITTASLHYHFPTKARLIAEVLRQDGARMHERMAAIEGEADTFVGRLDLIRRHFLAAQDEPGAIGPALVAVVDLFTLPPESQSEVHQWFLSLEGWLSRFAMQARTSGELGPERPLDLVVSESCASLLAAMLLPRTRSHLSSLPSAEARPVNRIQTHLRPPGADRA